MSRTAPLLCHVKQEAEVGLINPYRLPSAAHWREAVGTHGFANMMRKKPSCLVRAFQNTMELVGRNAFLAGAHQVDCL